MILGVSGGVALIDDYSLAFENRAGFYAAHGDGKLAALEVLVERGAALDIFRERLRMFVIGMIAADGCRGLAFLVAGIVGRLAVDRPETFFLLRWVDGIGEPGRQAESGRREQDFLHLNFSKYFRRWFVRWLRIVPLLSLQVWDRVRQ